MFAPNRPGAVHALIAPFAARRQHEPDRVAAGAGRHWEYMFYLDVAGHQRDPGVAAALAELKGLAPFLKVLGSYPAATP